LELLGFDPLKYCPPLYIHLSQRFFQFWKYSWNTSSGILVSSASRFSLITWTDSNFQPSSTDFSLLKRKKSTGARSGEYGGWGTSIISCFVRKLRIRREEFAGATIFFPSTNQALISSLPLSAFSSPSNNISCSLSDHEVEIHDELCPHNQKT